MTIERVVRPRAADRGEMASAKLTEDLEPYWLTFTDKQYMVR